MPNPESRMQTRVLLDRLPPRTEPALQERVYDVLLGALHRRELTPGEVMNESILARQLGVSRSPVREAIYRLAREGFVERAANGRYYVAGLSEGDIFNLYAVRAALEGLAAVLACQRMTTRDIDELAEVVRMEEAAAAREDADGLLAAGDAYHGKLMECAANPFLTEMIEMLRSRARPYSVKSSSLASRRTHAVREHVQIIDALRARDCETVRRLMEEHIVQSRRRLLQANVRTEEGQQDGRGEQEG